MPAPTKPSGKIVAAIGATKESARFQIDAVGPTDCLAVPAPGEVLTWDGTQWVPGAGGAGINELDQDVLAGPGSGKQSATVVALQNYALSASAPANGEALVWNGVASEWQPTALPVPVTDVTASSPLSSSGGSTPDISLDAGTTAGDVLTWDGSVWAGATPPVPVTDVTASSPLSSSGGTTPDISIDSGGAAGEVLTWDGAAWVSAAPVDTGLTELTQDVLAGPGSGSQIATVVGLQTRPVSNAAPNVGDVLTWDGTQWVPMSTFTSANFDAFGRLRASEPQTIFDSKLVYDAQPLYWAESQTPIGPGAPPAGAWLASDARVRLTVNGVNQTSIRQSRRYFSYQPGKSQLIFVTYNLNGAVAGATKRVGYFDASNGILLELTGAGASLVRRSGSSTASDTQPQASWNLDTMDGTGPSGVDLQFDKTAILIIDFEWLGVGSIRVGFVVNGQIIYAHRFDSANLNAAVYMSTPNLPVRYEISTTGAFAGSTYMDCICSSVNSEGGLQAAGTQYAYVMPALTTNVPGGATRTLFSIRHNAAYSRVTVIPINVSPCSDSNGVNSWELVYNPTLAGATWTTLNQGYLDIDIAGTATGGTVLEAGTFTDAVGAQNLNLRDTTLTLGADVAGVSDVISLRVKNLSGNNHTFIASLAWIAVT